MCCNDMAYPKNGVKLSCCKGKPIDRSKQLCCPKLGVADVDDINKATCCAAGMAIFYHYLSRISLGSPENNGNIFFLMNMYIHICIIYACAMNCTQSPTVLITHGYNII